MSIWFSSSFIGERRLGALEAVVFDAPHVECALAIVSFAGLLVKVSMATEMSVAMLIRLLCVLITLHESIGSNPSNLRNWCDHSW